MKIWLDDVRRPEEHGRLGWFWVSSAKHAIECLQQGDISDISLDHDLGIYSTIGITSIETTGYTVACWIEERVKRDANYFPPRMYVHSDNPVGRANINRAILSINRIMAARYHDWITPR